MVEFYTRPLAVVGISALSVSIWARHPTEWTVSGVLVELAGPIPQRISPVRNQGIGGAPGGTQTPDLLVRSHKSKNAKCPIWRRLRTGNAILPSISCTQCCTQNRIISAEFGHAVTASASKLPQQVSVHSEQLAGSGWRIVSRFPSSKPVYGEITIRQRQVPMYNPRRFPPFRSRRSGPQFRRHHDRSHGETLFVYRRAFALSCYRIHANDDQHGVQDRRRLAPNLAWSHAHLLHRRRRCDLGLRSRWRRRHHRSAV